MATRAKNSKALWWGTGGVAAVAIALTAYATLSGGSHPGHPSAGPSTAPVTSTPTAVPTYTVPPGWTEPDRWAALPRGARTDAHGDAVGFPHTADGAVATMAAANSNSLEGSRNTVDVQLAIFASYMSPADQTAANKAKVKSEAVQEDAALRRGMGLPVGGPLPPGAYVHINTVGFKVIEASPDQVSAYLLTQVARKSGETAKEKDSYTVAVLAVRWQEGDWKVSSEASTAASQQAVQTPKIAAPGDAGFNSAGWTAIRSAS